MHDIHVFCSARYHSIDSEKTVGNRKDEKIHLNEIPAQLALSPFKREDRKRTIKQKKSSFKEDVLTKNSVVTSCPSTPLDFYNMKQSVYEYLHAGGNGRTKHTEVQH